MIEAGSQVQNAIYLGGGEWPLAAADREARTAEVLETGPLGARSARDLDRSAVS